MLPLDEPVLQQPVLLVDVYFLQEPVLLLDASIPRIRLPNVGVKQSYPGCVTLVLSNERTVTILSAGPNFKDDIHRVSHALFFSVSFHIFLVFFTLFHLFMDE